MKTLVSASSSCFWPSLQYAQKIIMPALSNPMPRPVTSVNQTLADALARKFIEVMGTRTFEHATAAISTHIKVKTSPEGLVNAFTKMAKACYGEMLILGLQKIDGRRSYMSSAQWEVSKKERDIYVALQHMRPKSGPLVQRAKIEVKIHLLSRLFLRLNTINHVDILNELAPAIRLLLAIEMFGGFEWVFKHTGHDTNNSCVQIAVPSPNGLICGMLEPTGFHFITFVDAKKLSSDQRLLWEESFSFFPDVGQFGASLINGSKLKMTKQFAILNTKRSPTHLVGIGSEDTKTFLFVDSVVEGNPTNYQRTKCDSKILQGLSVILPESLSDAISYPSVVIRPKTCNSYQHLAV